MDLYEGCDWQEEWYNLLNDAPAEGSSDSFTTTQKVCNNSHKLSFSHVSFGT